MDIPLKTDFVTTIQIILRFALKLDFFLYTQVIRNELFRNLGLAFLCVFIVTLLLIANIWTCLLVGSCVVLTLVRQAILLNRYTCANIKMCRGGTGA